MIDLGSIVERRASSNLVESSKNYTARVGLVNCRFRVRVIFLPEGGHPLGLHQIHQNVVAESLVLREKLNKESNELTA